VDCVEFAALDTLQYRMPGHAEQVGRYEHRQIAVGGIFDEASAEFIGEPDPPGRAGGGLPGDESVVDPAVHGGGNDVELARRFGDADRIGVGGFSAGRVAGYLPVGARLDTIKAVKACPRALVRPCLLRIPAMAGVRW
jgi:hypothetical protein